MLWRTFSPYWSPSLLECVCHECVLLLYMCSRIWGRRSGFCSFHFAAYIQTHTQANAWLQIHTYVVFRAPTRVRWQYMVRICVPVACRLVRRTHNNHIALHVIMCLADGLNDAWRLVGGAASLISVVCITCHWCRHAGYGIRRNPLISQYYPERVHAVRW